MNSLEMFKYFVDYVKNNTLEDTIKEWGGGYLYIPSYKNTYRNKYIFDLYTQGKHIKDIAKEVNLSISRVSAIIRSQKRYTQKVTP